MSRPRQQGGPVEGSLRLIEAVARLGAGITARELAMSLNMPPATTYRLLNHLVATECLVRVDNLRGFALGRRMDRIMGAAVAPFIPAAARTVLDDLRERIRFGVHLVVYQADTVRIGDADPDRPLHSEHDLIRHPHASAAGKLLLAHVGDWTGVVTELVQLTERTLITAEALETDLRRIRESDLACQTGELDRGVACMAVPIRSKVGEVVGALCLAGPENRATALGRHIEELRAAAEPLSSLIS